MKRRGQAAMEFLMTYGWAILAAIIAIGVLAYFGVFNLSAPSQATVNAPWYANAWNVNAALDNVSIEFRNNGGETLTVQSLTLSITDPASQTCTFTAQALDNVEAGTLRSIGVVTDVSNCGDGNAINLITDDQFRATVSLNYRRPGSSLDLQSTGQITATAV